MERREGIEKRFSKLRMRRHIQTHTYTHSHVPRGRLLSVPALEEAFHALGKEGLVHRANHTPTTSCCGTIATVAFSIRRRDWLRIRGHGVVLLVCVSVCIVVVLCGFFSLLFLFSSSLLSEAVAGWAQEDEDNQSRGQGALGV